MRLYRAVKKGDKVLKVFNAPKGTIKVNGLYLAPQPYIANAWGENLYRGDFDIYEIEVPSELNVVAAVDGFYSAVGFEKMAKLYCMSLREVMKNPKIKYGFKTLNSRNVVYNVTSLSEIVVRPVDVKKVKVIGKVTFTEDDKRRYGEFLQKEFSIEF